MLTVLPFLTVLCSIGISIIGVRIIEQEEIGVGEGEGDRVELGVGTSRVRFLIFEEVFQVRVSLLIICFIIRLICLRRHLIQPLYLLIQAKISSEPQQYQS